MTIHQGNHRPRRCTPEADAGLGEQNLAEAPVETLRIQITPAEEYRDTDVTIRIDDAWRISFATQTTLENEILLRGVYTDWRSRVEVFIQNDINLCSE